MDQDGVVDIHVFKMLCALYEPAFENWAKFAEDFLLHENPYTGRRYIDEPGMPLISLVNEGGFFVGWNSGGRDDPRVAAAWREWMIARRAADPAFAPDLTPDESPRVFWWLDVHPAIAQWTGELEAKMVARMKAHLRSLGCRALITNDNCGPHYAALQRATTDLDYIDDHFYIDHPRFSETPWKLPSTCQNTNPLLGSEPLRPSEQAFTRMLGKPFTISEWNFAAPSRFRGMGGLLAGAMAALQGWDGLWRFAYAHHVSFLDNHSTASPNYFDCALDPLMAASDLASVCLFLRGEAAKEQSDERRVTGDEGQVADGYALRLDKAHGSMTLVTPRLCGGFAENGRIDAGPLSFEIAGRGGPALQDNSATHHSSLGHGVPTTLWVTSLDGEPVASSSRLLLVHLTDVQGDGRQFADDTMTTLLAWGGRPIVRTGKAQVEIRFKCPPIFNAGDPFCVFALDTAGNRVAEVPVTFEEGTLRFTVCTADTEGGRIFYEIACHPWPQGAGLLDTDAGLR